jgi:TonB-dependent SusC/RagA subfamily outer membrane receptor
MKQVAMWGTLAVLVALAACGGKGATNSGPFSPAPEPADQNRPSAQAGTLSSGQPHYENMVEMLRGKVPGLEIIETEPGRIEVRIRGGVQSFQETMQEPLVVVDGMAQARRAGEVLMALNPQDVASIDVLKDVSSTAIYGTRGANGVIIVKLVRRS